jgi:serine/threonine protein kinase
VLPSSCLILGVKTTISVEEYRKKSKQPHATIFKPQQPYKRVVSETFKDFPSSVLSLLEVLLAIEPNDRGTASSALQNEVDISYLLRELTQQLFYQLLFLVNIIFCAYDPLFYLMIQN